MPGTHWDSAPVPDSGSAPSTPLGSITAGVDVGNTAQVQQFREDANRAKSMAEQGGFAINEDGGLLYTKACDTFLQAYENIAPRTYYLKQRPKFGARPYAQKLADQAHALP